jgi:hypothetical protein
MKKNTNIFVLTTEYHFLLSMNIIFERYSSIEFRNILIFTGERLSEIITENLPINVETEEINVEREMNLRKKIHDIILQDALTNLFVFTAYRDLETYLLTTVTGSVDRHLVQDGANFYFKILKPVMLSRIKETVKIYRNLWRKGILLKKIVLFKKHMAQCGFIDYVWITNPEIYRNPLFSSKPIVKLNLLNNEISINACCKYFSANETQQYCNSIIYLSSRITQQNDILCEISQIKSVVAKFEKHKLLIKLHPNSPVIQVDLFKAAFKDCVVKNYVPAEIYLARAINSYIFGGVSASLYYNNPNCKYFTLIKIYQRLGIFPDWIKVKFPAHVKVLENLEEFNDNRLL